MNRRAPLTLLEIMIALSLAAIILSTLLYSYKQYSLHYVNLTKCKEELLLKTKLQLRLSQVFSKIANHSHFYLEKGKLFFHFDYGIDPRPDFCGKLQGLLYVDAKQRLPLISWSEKEEPRREVLFEKVSNLKFFFFDQKEKKWVGEWSKDKGIPPLFKILVNGENFSFFLSPTPQKL